MKEKKFKLPREFAEKWLKNLRSGKFQQGVEYLEFRTDEQGDFHCCLGVACRTVCPNTNLFLENSYVSSDYLEPEDVDTLTESGLPGELLGDASLPSVLAYLNDGVTHARLIENILKSYTFREEILKRTEETLQLSFSEIADWIEDNVEFYDT